MTSPDTLNAISTEPPNTTSLLATMQQSSTHNPRILSTSGTCHPEIHQAPGPAEKETGWELLCEAPCGPGMAVRWTLAPGGLEAYERREAGAQAWLSVPPDGLIPEGWFQCRLDPGGQVASLYVPGQVFLKTCKCWCWGRAGRDGLPRSELFCHWQYWGLNSRPYACTREARYLLIHAPRPYQNVKTRNCYSLPSLSFLHLSDRLSWPEVLCGFQGPDVEIECRHISNKNSKARISWV
jgi:hypothetical protein